MPETITREEFEKAYENGGFRRTVAVLKRLGAEADQAEDLAQGAWGARGWTKRHQLKDARQVVQWVTSIAVNLFRTETARNRRLTTFSAVGKELSISPNVRPDVIDLYRALRCCPEHQRVVVEAVYLLGNTRDEVATRLRISKDAVDHRLWRARRRLRCGMEEA